MTDAKQHGARRKLLSRPFSRTHIVEHWEPTVRSNVALAVSQIKGEAMTGQADILKWWYLLGADVSAHLAFGENFHMLKYREVGFPKCRPSCQLLTTRAEDSPDPSTSEADERGWYCCRASCIEDFAICSAQVLPGYLQCQRGKYDATDIALLLY